MSKLPLFLEIEGRDVVVVGGGAVAARKVDSLLRHGARVRVIAPDLHDSLSKQIDSKRINWSEKRFEPSDADGAFAIFAATNDPKVNAEVAVAGRERGALVSVADDSARSDFQLGAVIEKRGVVVAIATGGKSPAASRVIRDRIDASLTDDLLDLVEMLGELRTAAKRDLSTDAERKAFFDAILSSEVPELLRRGDRSGARARLASIQNEFGVESKT